VFCQGLHLEPLQQPYFCEGVFCLFVCLFFWDRVLCNYLPGLALNHNPPDLCLLNT
jgi:hypothetical protein